VSREIVARTSNTVAVTRAGRWQDSDSDKGSDSGSDSGSDGRSDKIKRHPG
jgi:hypothetical protein